MTDSEIIGQIKAKYDNPALVTQQLGYPTVEQTLMSIAQVPPDLSFEISNKPYIGDNVDNSLSFKLDNIDQAVRVIDKFYNLRGTSYKMFVTEIIADKNIEADDDIYLNFYLIKSAY